MFTHSTWLVVFFWSHFWFQWFWFLSIIEVSEFFLRATLITINKWLQKLRSERKGLRLTVKPIKKKSLSRSSFGSHYGCLKSTKRKFSYELKSRVGRWGPHAPHWYFLHYFFKILTIVWSSNKFVFFYHEIFYQSLFGLSVPQSQR